MSDPPGDEPLEEPPEVAEVDSFAEVTELNVEFSATRARFSLKGPGTPAHFAHLIFPFVLSLFGLVVAATLLLADRSDWLLAGTVAAISQVVALVWWKITRRQERTD